MSLVLKQLLTQQYCEPLTLSKIFYANQASVVQKQFNSQNFIPFLNERDRMNRLVKQSLLSSDFSQHRRGKTVSENISKVESIDLSLKRSKQLIFRNPEKTINMNFFHQKTHLFNMNKPDSRLRKKNIITVKHQYPTQNKQSTFQRSNSVSKNSVFKISSAVSPPKSHHQKLSKKEKRVVSSKHHRITSNNYKQRAKSSISLRSNRKQKQVQKQQSQQEIQSYPQLARFRQMKKLGIKVIQNFQDGHSNFIQKMKAAKRTAIKMIQQNNI